MNQLVAVGALLPSMLLLTVLWLWPGKVLRTFTVLVGRVQRPIVVVRDRVAAHDLLIRVSAGGSFSDRPASTVPSSVLSRHRFDNTSSAPYGPLWRTFRRNLTSEVFHPLHLHRYESARRRALSRLLQDLRQQSKSNPSGLVLPAESIRTAMFGLIVEMCFGEGVDEGLIRAMFKAMNDLVQIFPELSIFSKLPVSVAKIFYRERWNKLVTLRRNQEQMYIPLIQARRNMWRNHSGEATTFVDTLIAVQVEGDGRSLVDGELVGMCSEFLGAGTNAVATQMHWIMAELVKNPDMQEIIREEIDDVVDADAEEVSADVVGKLDYLNAVIMEGLRLHPTLHSIFREVMKRDHIILDGRRLRTGTMVIFPIARPALDKTAWEDPKEFKPERFLAGGDGENMSLLAGAGCGGEIRMMPFGAGRRMCPGMGVAMLHMAYFMANVLREFEWKDPEGEFAVDLKPQGRNNGLFTLMKRPLCANLVLRREDKHKT